MQTIHTLLSSSIRTYRFKITSYTLHTGDVQKLLFLGSSCIYPREVQQPMPENALMTGILEATNEPTP